MSYTEPQGKRLAARVNQARRSKGLTHQALSTAAQVSRPVLSRLINHGEVPGRRSTRDAIGAALGWGSGSCDAILAGGEPIETAVPLVISAEAGMGLAQRIEQARQDVGLSKQELALISGVSRPQVSRLINHGEVPSKQSTRDAIGAALGWAAGSCDAVLNGGEPTLCGSAQSALIVAERLRAIAAEAQAAAEESDRQAQRWRSIGDNALAAALLALRGGQGN